MSDSVRIDTTPEKDTNYEVSVPGEEGLVGFTHREEMFKYLNMKLDELPEDGEYDADADENERTVHGG